jgi:antitoxin (DNA-binding transcriptional repressor) of toxin-antitoxin stability system
MATPRSAPTTDDALALESAIRALGDYSHVRVRAGRGHLTIFTEDDYPVARLTPLGGAQYGLSYFRHTGRWEKMPFVGQLAELAQTTVELLGPSLQRWDFSCGNNGSGH